MVSVLDSNVVDVKSPTGISCHLGFALIFKLYKCMVEVPHLRPTAVYQISTSILVEWVL
jgi:hypothetical protein